EGMVEALDTKVFYEFLTTDVGESLPLELGTVMVYNLTIPIRGQALFQNTQIDAKVGGELNLNQTGNQDMNFGGEIFVEDGNVFSYKDNFEGLQGYITFDNKGFNPIMNLVAHTDIDDERINLRIIGGMDDLDIILESASGFSESDILELLTWGKRFEDQELSSTGFGNQTVSILGSLLENQLEKNLKGMPGMIAMNLVDDIDISGTASLINPDVNEDFEVTAKRKIGDKTYLNLSYIRSFSLTNNAQIGVEYKLNRHFSVVGNIDDMGNLNVKYRYRYAY
ncbi:MAG: translocation/assembly module TamB domain-containing protein, partial [Candidatus Neomarinimicrobiota bacterium]|nr:translocation/assembly module TamB domain-containing protein [Candidatus Neomarinimicrobiota bacterium]